MKKIYTSRSIPHFSVGGARIAFTPLSNKSSYFETTDEALQKRIEAHPWFGDKFILGAEEAVSEKGKAIKANTEEKKTELKEMRFTTLADAKDWLAANFGVVRSNIKKKDDAVSIGKTNGVSVIFKESGTPADDIRREKTRENDKAED